MSTADSGERMERESGPSVAGECDSGWNAVRYTEVEEGQVASHNTLIRGVITLNCITWAGEYIQFMQHPNLDPRSSQHA